MRRKGSRELRGVISVSEVKLLKEALDAAQLKNCTCSDAAKQEMRLYLHSWVANPLKIILAGLESRHAAALLKSRKQ